MNSESEQLPKPSKLLVYIVLTVVVAVWISWACFGIEELRLHLKDASLAKLGLFGDMFGCINALFSALAFVFGFHVFRLQNWQIKVQARRNQENICREKLQLIFAAIAEFRKRMMSASRAFLAEPKMDHYKWYEIVNGVMEAHWEIDSLCELYFSPYVKMVVPPSPFDGVFAAAEKVRDYKVLDMHADNSPFTLAMTAFEQYMESLALQNRALVRMTNDIVERQNPLKS